MIESPCRHCPKRHMDKNLCSHSCPLLNKLQRFQASRGAQQPSMAIDLEDPDRYSLTAAFDSHKQRMGGMAI